MVERPKIDGFPIPDIKSFLTKSFQMQKRTEQQIEAMHMGVDQAYYYVNLVQDNGLTVSSLAVEREAWVELNLYLFPKGYSSIKVRLNADAGFDNETLKPKPVPSYVYIANNFSVIQAEGAAERMIKIAARFRENVKNVSLNSVKKFISGEFGMPEEEYLNLLTTQMMQNRIKNQNKTHKSWR